MKTFTINNKQIEFDETKTYRDFYLKGGNGILSEVDFEKMLETVESGNLEAGDEFKDFLTYLKRWTVDAPRKRFNRQMRKDGMIVLTTDYLFEEDGGEEIIDSLENCGKLADYLLNELFT